MDKKGKKCIKCGEVKDLDQFYVNILTKEKSSANCIQCTLAFQADQKHSIQSITPESLIEFYYAVKYSMVKRMWNQLESIQDYQDDIDQAVIYSLLRNLDSITAHNNVQGYIWMVFRNEVLKQRKLYDRCSPISHQANISDLNDYLDAIPSDIPDDSQSFITERINEIKMILGEKETQWLLNYYQEILNEITHTSTQQQKAQRLKMYINRFYKTGKKPVYKKKKI